MGERGHNLLDTPEGERLSRAAPVSLMKQDSHRVCRAKGAPPKGQASAMEGNGLAVPWKEMG